VDREPQSEQARPRFELLPWLFGFSSFRRKSQTGALRPPSGNSRTNTTGVSRPTLLYEELKDDERRKIFEIIAGGAYHLNPHEGVDEDPPEEIEDAQEFRSGLISTLAFIYLGLWSTAVPFDELVEAAVFQSERDHLDQLVDVSLTIVEQEPMYAVESAINKLEAHEINELDYTEMRLLIKFITDPTEFHPESERQKALERLNRLISSCSFVRNNSRELGYVCDFLFLFCSQNRLSDGFTRQRRNRIPCHLSLFCDRPVEREMVGE
jgi:ribosomal protein S18